eukprot:CAMPEP_0119573428 /NCGR_PEP_ID=MMETSP1352-20130426/45117_1 /TAXON_ID=265584 /ORGANISM="Stauroneis constricta, Strain CCMP1120" /LENGTH=500 /DNA_ID=CAMNT_0007623117 /DNA_START=65 /DNA_END=1567 /DNA_ORIENTATION=+
MASTKQPGSVLHHILEQNVEWLGRRLLHSAWQDTEQQLEYWNSMKSFCAMLPSGPKAGRRHITVQCSKIFLAVTLVDGDGLRTSNSKRQPEHANASPDAAIGALASVALHDWKTKHWDLLKDLIDDLHCLVIRKDAEVSFLMQDGAQCDESEHPRALTRICKEEFNKLQKYIRVQTLICTLRHCICNDDIGLSPDDVDDRASFVNAQSELREQFRKTASTDDVERLIARCLFEKNELKSAAELRAQLQKKPFCLTSFAQKLRDTLNAWCDDILGGTSPFRALYSTEPLDLVRPDAATGVGRLANPLSSKIAVAKLKSQRKNLNELVEDPINESNRIADQYKRQRRDSVQHSRSGSADSACAAEATNKKRKESSSGDASSPSEHSPRNIGEAGDEDVPRNGISRQGPKPTIFYEKNPAGTALSFDDSLNSSAHEFSPPKRYSQRRKWTDEERKAVKEGVVSFGKSQWKAIKASFPDILKGRTASQIKDCYRTMVKQGEISE